jgi:UDP-2,3-diacylglucosamine pyrophosphatase LpxH
MIIAVSDVHLGWEDTKGRVKKQDEFFEFLKQCNTDKIDHLVLLGDIFDFWADSNVKIFSTNTKKKSIRKIVERNEELFFLLATLHAKNVHYVVGNHDFLIHDLCARNPETYPFKTSRVLRLRDGDRDFFFTHGYDLDVWATMELSRTSVSAYEKTCISLSFLTSATGWAAVNLWGLGERFRMLFDENKSLKRELKKDPEKRGEKFQTVEQFANSRAAGLFLGMKPGDNLVYGHTHRPYFYKGAGGYEIANTGYWAQKESRDIKGVNTFVRIDNGEMGVCTYTGGNILTQKCD